MNRLLFHSLIFLIMISLLYRAIQAFSSHHKSTNKGFQIKKHFQTKVYNSPKIVESDEALIDTKIPENFSSSFLTVLLERGFIHQCTDFKGLDEKFSNSQKPVMAYLGFDATAKSLHVGSLLQIMILRHLQKCGHKPVILIGGGTTKVGDPTGKDESRQLLSAETIQENANSLASVFSKFIKFGESAPNEAIMVNNADWLNNLNYLDFLRDYGRYFTINRMLSYESVKQVSTIQNNYRDYSIVNGFKR